MFAAVGDGAGFVLGFKNLAEIIFRKNDCVLLFGGVQRGVADVQQIGAERKMRAVFFENAEMAGGRCPWIVRWPGENRRR